MIYGTNNLFCMCCGRYDHFQLRTSCWVVIMVGSYGGPFLYGAYRLWIRAKNLAGLAWPLICYERLVRKVKLLCHQRTRWNWTRSLYQEIYTQSRTML